MNKIMKNPANYKRQSSLIKAMNKVSEGVMTVSVALWLQNVKNILIDKWGWEEKEASKFVVCYHPREAGYIANS